MADQLETIQILFVKRNAPKRGRTSSDDYNDMIDEIAHDLAAFNTQWNNRLVPLTSALPDGTIDTSIDAFTNGLSGRHLYTDADATATSNSTYYNSSSSRPYSVLEQFGLVYGEIQSVRNDLGADLLASTPTAEQIIIADTGGYYTAETVEDALTEVKVLADNISAGALDLSAVAQNYIPLSDNTWDIGSSSKRIKDLFLGPSSLHIEAKITDAGYSANREYVISVDGTTNDLQIVETNSGDTLLHLDSNRLGVHTSNPSGPLHVVGTVNSTCYFETPTTGTQTIRMQPQSGSANQRIQMRRTYGVSTDDFVIYSSFNENRIDSPSTKRIVFGVNGDDNFAVGANGNIGIGTILPDTSAILHLSGNEKGFLPPQMSTTDKNNISSPATGLIVYDTTLNKICVYTGSGWETVTSS